MHLLYYPSLEELSLRPEAHEIIIIHHRNVNLASPHTSSPSYASYPSTPHPYHYLQSFRDSVIITAHRLSLTRVTTVTNGIESSVNAPVRALSRQLNEFFEFIGDAGFVISGTVRRILLGDVSVKDTIAQMASIGVNSIPIVLVTTAFSGAVLALYTSQLLVEYGAGSLVGGGISLSVARELAPVLTAVVVAARAGSAIAAEIGTMKVTEQIDALRSMGTSPIQYLAVPRFLALVIMLPVLTMLGMVVGCFGGYVVAVSNGVTSGSFLDSSRVWVEFYDIAMGLLKTVFFGAFIATVGTQQGLATTGGAAGVGKNTMNAVVISMILIYISNYFLAYVMFGGSTPGF
jgi:phospholipid/cholesterol/gamma-HCH transport system permease protein